MNLVRIAYVSKPHGLKGEFVTAQDAGEDSALAYLERIYLSSPTGPEEFHIKRRALTPKGWRIALEEITSIEQAELLRSREILADRADLEEPGEDEYYVNDLIGAKVFDEDNAPIGTLTSIEDVATPNGQKVTGRWWLSINGNEIAVPATKRFITNVDAKKKEIRVQNLSEVME